MKKLNKDDLMKIILLSAFAFFFGKIIITGEIKNYVHPRIIPFVYFALIGFAVMIICEIEKGISKAEVNFRLKRYVIFCITLVLIFYMEFNNSGDIRASSTNIASLNGMNSSTGNNPVRARDNSNDSKENRTSTTGKSEINTDTDSLNNIELEENSDVITVNRDNYVYSLNEILSRPEKYDKRKIEISGFIYKDSSVKEDEFIIGRYMMVCCAANLQIAGIKCIDDKGSNSDYSSGTWVKVQGTISDIDDEAVVKADSIEIDKNPDKQYVYPF